jgi:hypothetical protein
MKRIVALLVTAAFVLSLVPAVLGQSMEDEAQKVRDYLKVVDAKIVKFRKAGNTAKMKQMQAEKQATLRRWEKLKAGMVAPPPPPVAAPPPPPPPPPVRAAPAAGLLGMGLMTQADLGIVAGNMIGLLGSIVLPDPMGLAGMVGLPANAVSYKLGLGYAQGKDKNESDWKAVPIIVDGVLSLPADMMGGIESYVGAGINYVVYRTGQTGGSLGGQAYAGVQGDLGLGGKTYGQVGIGYLRTGDGGDKGSYSTGYGLSLLVGQKILL